MVASAGLVSVVACTQDFGVFEPDAATGTDAANDTAQPMDSATDTTVKDAGVDVGTDAGSLTFACQGGPVSDCSQCTGAPEPCVYCANGNPSAFAGACVAANTNCLTAAPNGFQDCACINPSNCPESYQVCTGAGHCHTCEDNNSNNGLTCKSGGKCDALDGGCL